MFAKLPSYKFVMALMAVLMLVLAACAPAAPQPQSGAEPTKPAPTAAAVNTDAPKPTVAPTDAPTQAPTLPAMDADEILLQLDYEPGFVMQEFRYPFGRTPSFTLLADGRVIYVDEKLDSKVMLAQLTPAEAAALLQQVRDMGFSRLQSHTDMCGKLADGTEPCISDASTTVMRVRMEDGKLREIKNYANFSNGPVTYEAIYALMNDFAHPQAAVFNPQGATLFVRIAPPPEQASPADWPLDPAYVARAQSAADQFVAVALSADEAAKWQKEVGIDSMPVPFHLNGKTVSASFVPWLPGVDYAKDIAAEFPGK